MLANVIQDAVSATSGSNDASACAEPEVNGTPLPETPANDLGEAVCTAYGSNASNTAELEEDGTSAAKRSANVVQNAASATRAVTTPPQ